MNIFLSNDRLPAGLSESWEMEEAERVMLDISRDVEAYKEQIEHFLSQLDEERYFIKLTIERIFNSRIVLIKVIDDEIAGICGIAKWHLFYKSYFLFSRKCQGKGVGKAGSITLNKLARGDFYLIAGVVDTQNKGMLKVYLKTGYKVIGRREEIIYLVAPLNARGWVAYRFIKLIFPLVSSVWSVTNRGKAWQPEM